MEILSPDESSSQIKPGQTRELGRGEGLSSSDRTISRRHVSFTFPPFTDRNQEPRLQFEVLGRNPIYVHKNGEVKVFRRFEGGEIESGDMFCVTAKDPVWYTLRKAENCAGSVRQNDLSGKLDSDIGFNGVEDLEKEDVGIPDMNPVKEFGFLVMGHEFDSYPKKMIRDFKNWNWFLEDAGKDSEVDDSREKRTRKRKKGAENDDEEWTGESEDDKELINKTKKAPKPKYVTRSKDLGKPLKDKSKGKGSTRKGESREVEEEDEEDEDEEDQMLGGFIVDDENLELEEEVEEMDDEDEEEIGDESDEDEDE